jgi:hypothetical protein
VSALDLPGLGPPPEQVARNFREQVDADVAAWPAELRERWGEIVSSNHGGAWDRYPKAEVELRAWLELRDGPRAREPVVLNRHHLTPVAPQPAGRDWPPLALYCGRAPTSAAPLTERAGLVWRHAHLLGNPYDAASYPDALERYRLDLRRHLQADKVKPSPVADAIRELTGRSALVCSCVSSPWTPEIRVPLGTPLPLAVRCHCHLIVAAWRALQPRAPAPGA